MRGHDGSLQHYRIFTYFHELNAPCTSAHWCQVFTYDLPFTNIWMLMTLLLLSTSCKRQTVFVLFPFLHYLFEITWQCSSSYPGFEGAGTRATSNSQQAEIKAIGNPQQMGTRAICNSSKAILHINWVSFYGTELLNFGVCYGCFSKIPEICVIAFVSIQHQSIYDWSQKMWVNAVQ